MLEGYIPVPIEHFGGLINSWPPEMLAETLLTEATNIRFLPAEVSSREGLSLAFQTPNKAAINGLVDYVQADGTELPLVFDASGQLFVERIAGSGNLAVAAPGSVYAPPVGSLMNGCAVFSRAYLAFGDGKVGTGAPASFDGTHLDPVTIAAPATVSTPADSATAGNIAAGVRYGMVLYKTREGSLTAAGPIFNWAAAGAKQVTISGLPIGPASVAARVVAFTVAGGTSAGPYFYIGASQTVNGIVETSTVVSDNVTTTATFNFDDAFLASSNDVTDQFRAILLPDETGVVFSETTQRLMWWGDPTQPSVVQCSEPGDAGNYFGDTGFFQVAPNNGQRITAVFEFRNQLYVAKQDSLHLVTPNDGDPATWGVQQISAKVGAAGVRAAAVGSDFVFLAHRSGGYTFDGGSLAWVSDELLGGAPERPGLWQRVNWRNEHLVWAHVDENAKCVRVGVPLDASATCSHALKVSYLDGWEESLRFSPFTARYHYFPGRRWSLDTIAATQAMTVKRPLALAGMPADRRSAVAQVLLGASTASGAVLYVDADATTDSGTPFAWAMRLGSVSAAETTKQNRQGMEMVGIVQLRARGAGAVVVEAVADGADPSLVGEVVLSDRTTDTQVLALMQGSAVGIRLSSGGAQAVAMRLLACYVFARPTWLLRPMGI